MRGKLVFSAASAALLLFAPAVLAQTADQPGDASTQAQLSGSTEGELSPAGDADWYRMNVEAGQRYSFTLEGLAVGETAAVDPVLAIYDAQGNQVAVNDDAGGTLNSALRYAPRESGQVFVEARGFSPEATGPYRLAVSAAPVPPDDVGNDAASTRAQIRSGQSVTGAIETEGDIDAYRLRVRSGQTYHITLAGAGDGGLGDPLLRVVDRQGGELASNDDSEDSLNSALDFSPQQSGEVFIEARAFSDAYAGTYTLSVNGSAGPRDSISADRNTRGRLNVGQNTSGVLDFGGDRDWYRVRLQTGQSYRFALAGSGDNALSDPLLRLYGPNGEELAMDDDGGEGLNSYLEYAATATGVYYLEARSFAESGAGGYSLSVRQGDIPGDNTTDASVSADGDYREGMLSPGGDHDWYRIDLAQGQGMRVGLASAEGNDALSDPYLVLHGPDGAEILRDDDGGEGLNSWFEYVAATAGAHYLEARGFTDDAAGRYVLTITPGEIGATPEGAEMLQANSDGRTSTIGANDDVDWYMIELVEGRPYRFYLDGVGDDALADPYLVLYDAEGHEVASDDDGGAGFNSYITYASRTGGTYYVAASSFNHSGGGRYGLRVADTDVPGSPNTDEALDANSDERVSRIDMPGDLDVYRTDLEAGARYTIEVVMDGENALADPYVSLIDPNGQTVTEDDDSGDGRNARVLFSPEQSGTYFIQASGLGGSTGGYQVRIMRQ
jgi:hypothetical protein